MRLNPLSKQIAWRERAIDFGIGAIGVLGMAPVQFWPAAVLSLALLFLRLIERSDSGGVSAGYSTGFWTGFGFFSLGMFWIGMAFIERGAAYIPLIIPLVLGLFVLLSFFWGLAGAAFAKLRGDFGWDAMTFAALFFTAEFTRGHLFGGFPWNLHGYAFEAGTALSQSASMIGVYGLTLLIWIAGGLAGLAWSYRRKMVVLIPTGGVAIILGGMFGYGALRLSDADVAVVEGVSLRLVHVPFRQSEMMDRTNSVTITNRYFEQTFAPGIDTVSHIIWPEGSVRGLAMDNLNFLSVIPTVMESDYPGVETPYFLFSSIRKEMGPKVGSQNDTRYFNSAVIAGFPDGAPAILGYSDKKRLVPFGEIVPFSDAFAAIGFEAIAASFDPAPNKANVSFPGLPSVSVQICYEVIFSGLTEDEPKFILNQSNDAWFGQLLGPSQHAATSRMRAVEQGVPIVRSAANGWSGTIDPYGRWLAKLGPKDTGVLDVNLPNSINPTPFSWQTNAILLLISLSVILSSVLAGRNRARGVVDTTANANGGSHQLRHGLVRDGQSRHEGPADHVSNRDR